MQLLLLGVALLATAVGAGYLGIDFSSTTGTIVISVSIE